jgi:hypothetical protein
VEIRTLLEPWIAKARAQLDRESSTETRRQYADYNTGTINRETAILIRAICLWKRPDIVIEVGTFIGTSTQALLANKRLYTCDKNNDCVPSTATIVTHPYTRAGTMCRKIQALGVKGDLAFLDGRLKDAEPDELLAVMHSNATYLFDDYTVTDTWKLGKGVMNVSRLHLKLPSHVLIRPEEFALGTSLAMLIPK